MTYQSSSFLQICEICLLVSSFISGILPSIIFLFTQFTIWCVDRFSIISIAKYQRISKILDMMFCNGHPPTRFFLTGSQPGPQPGSKPGYQPGPKPGPQPGSKPGYQPGSKPGYQPGP